MNLRKQGRAGLVHSPSLRFAGLLIGFFALQVFTHATLLRLPYYWDEAGYYIPSAFDLLRTGTLVPFSTLTNAHPPGLSLFLAAAWTVFGFSPLVTRLSVCLLSALALCAVYRLTRVALSERKAAVAVALLTAAYPVWFTQSTLAHADMAAASATLWGLVFLWSPAQTTKTLWAAAGCFTLAALSKEIAVGTPLALAAYELFLLVRKRGDAGTSLRRAALLLLPLLPLAGWFAYHRWRAGFFFGNPEYLRYNATSTLSLARFLAALAHRAMHLSLYLNLFVPLLIALAGLILPPVRQQMDRALQRRVWVVIVANALLFSILGGALLCRYLLPVYPLVLLLAVAGVRARFQNWLWFPALGVAAFAAALWLPTPYRIAPEDTLAYRDAIATERDAIRFVREHYPHSTVLSAWPVTDALRKPELGYVSAPVPVVAIDNFSLPALQALAGAPQGFSTAIVFSTKYEPRGFALPSFDEKAEERYFNLHHDLTPAAVAGLLGGTVEWQERRGAEWAAVLRFEHPQLARFYNRPYMPGAALPCQEPAPAFQKHSYRPCLHAARFLLVRAAKPATLDHRASAASRSCDGCNRCGSAWRVAAGAAV